MTQQRPVRGCLLRRTDISNLNQSTNHPLLWSNMSYLRSCFCNSSVLKKIPAFFPSFLGGGAGVSLGLDELWSLVHDTPSSFDPCRFAFLYLFSIFNNGIRAYKTTIRNKSRRITYKIICQLPWSPPLPPSSRQGQPQIPQPSLPACPFLTGFAASSSSPKTHFI